MASRDRRGGLGGGRIGGGGDRDHIIHRTVAETPADRRAHIVRSEAAKKRAVRRYTNHDATPSPKLALYTAYATGASSSCHHPRSPMLPPSSSSDDDKADSERVIGPDNFVKDPTEEEHALAEAMAQKAEEADRLTALRAVEAF
jgi:hypothetical protein